MTTVEVLRRVRKRIAKPENWTTGTNARVRKGAGQRDPMDPNATCWCICGALIREVGGVDDNWEQIDRTLGDLSRRDHGGSCYTTWQDRSRHSSVLAWLDKIIKELEGQDR